MYQINSGREVRGTMLVSKGNMVIQKVRKIINTNQLKNQTKWTKLLMTIILSLVINTLKLINISLNLVRLLLHLLNCIAVVTCGIHITC
jgi:hypothetical protein